MQSRTLIAYDRAKHSGHEGIRDAFLFLFANDFISDANVEQSRESALMVPSSPSAMPTGQEPADTIYEIDPALDVDHFGDEL